MTKETEEIIFDMGIITNIQDEFQNHEKTRGTPFNTAVMVLSDSAGGIASSPKIDSEILNSKSKKNVK